MKAIIGYGRSGQAVAKILNLRNESAYICDLEEKKGAEKFSNMNYIWGEHPLWILDKVDEIIISPSVEMDSPFIKMAKEKNIRIISELEWALKQIDGIKIGITGTNGKSTTTSLISHIFNSNGIKATTAGNIGEPLSSFLNRERFSVYAIEISSFQLESMSLKLLDGAVLLNITPDHLNRHKTMEEYSKIKKRIFYLLKDGGIGIAPENIFPDLNLYRFGFSKNCDLKIEEEYLIYENEKIIKRNDLKLLGDHNWENAASAVLLSLKFGIKKEVLSEALRTFKPLEHRMEIVDVVDGVTFINDSKGTNVDSVLKALTGVCEGKTILILGGKDKNGDFLPLKDIIQNCCSTVFCIGEAREKILSTLENSSVQLISVEGLEDVFKFLDSYIENGSYVLLSPGCASFDQYKNFEERGKHFKELVKKWKERKSPTL